MQLHFFVLQYHKRIFFNVVHARLYIPLQQLHAGKLQLNKANVTEQKIKLTVWYSLQFTFLKRDVEVDPKIRGYQISRLLVQASQNVSLSVNIKV